MKYKIPAPEVGEKRVFVNIDYTDLRSKMRLCSSGSIPVPGRDTIHDVRMFELACISSEDDHWSFRDKNGGIWDTNIPGLASHRETRDMTLDLRYYLDSIVNDRDTDKLMLLTQQLYLEIMKSGEAYGDPVKGALDTLREAELTRTLSFMRHEKYVRDRARDEFGIDIVSVRVSHVVDSRGYVISHDYTPSTSPL